MQGPENPFPPPSGQPYQQPVGGPAPIPPPTGAPGNFNPAGGPRINFDVIGEGWTAFSQNPGVWIVSVLIAAIVAFVLYAVLMVPLALLGSRSSSGGSNSGGGIILLLMPVLFIVMGVAVSYLVGGLIRMALRQLSGQSISIGDLFSASDVIGQLILASILTSIATSIGLLACGVGSWVVSGLLMFTTPLIVDKRMSATDAMSASWNALKGEWLMATVFLLVLNLVASVGSLALGIGIIVSGPVALLALVALYRNFFGIASR